MMKAQWEGDRNHRLADVFREKHSLAGKMLILHAQEWGRREEQEAEQIRLEIDECDREIEKILAETYEQALKDAASIRADTLMKDRR